MTSTKIPSSDQYLILLAVKGFFHGTSTVPASVLYQAWTNSLGFVNVLVWGEMGGDDWQTSHDDGYIKGETTWPEQHALCLLGLKIKCESYADDANLFHAYGLMHQENNIQSSFMRNVLHSRQISGKELKFPAMEVELSENNMTIETSLPMGKVLMKARDKRSMRYKEVAEELEMLLRDSKAKELETQYGDTGQQIVPEDTTTAEICVYVDRHIIPILDNLVAQWGLHSKGHVIGKLLQDIFSDIKDDEDE